jgi:threonine dehydrogenase-like Zn-dependent dehydrogenase
MSDGETQSLDYLHRGFRGSVVADTSKPTGAGNYHVLCGMLQAFGLAPSEAVVGLIGCGNIGMHVIERLREHRTRMLAVESKPERREALERLGVAARAPHEKGTFLSEPMDALVLNASGGSLDRESVRVSSANPRLKVICGSENLVMQDSADAGIYRVAQKAYCPTELGGMMGYLTAVEQYLAQLAGVSFDVETLFEAATALERPACDATKYMLDHDFTLGFEEAVEAICAEG